MWHVACGTWHVAYLHVGMSYHGLASSYSCALFLTPLGYTCVECITYTYQQTTTTSTHTSLNSTHTSDIKRHSSCCRHNTHWQHANTCPAKDGHITSHHIHPSHHIKSHHTSHTQTYSSAYILSHPIHHITSYHIVSHHITSTLSHASMPFADVMHEMTCTYDMV